VDEKQPGTVRQGLLYGLAAYGWWGLVPLYFKLIADLPPAEVLAHRILWSLLFLGLLLRYSKRWHEVWRCFRSRRVLLALLGSTLLIAVNWYVYIYSVATRQVVQASLGYFVTPLVSVLLGMLWFKESLRRLQWAALALAVAGVVNLTAAQGQWPWIALLLAVSFGFYGLLRKRLAVDGLIGLSVEIVLLVPAAAGYLVYLGAAGRLTLGAAGVEIDCLLALSGVVTTVPLMCFAEAARRLPLSTLGFLQYVSPSLQLVLAVFLFHEPFTDVQLLSFGCIWAALAIYSLDMLFALRRTEAAVRR
jgi:chloramphenicol-sensitive protein RarD